MSGYLHEVLRNNQYALLAVLLLQMMRSDRAGDKEKILLIYAISGILVWAGDFDPIFVYRSIDFVLFLWLEFFCSDVWRVRYFSILGKVADFVFRFLFIDGGFFFTIAMHVDGLLAECEALVQWSDYLLLGFLVAACVQCARQSFEIKPIGEIVENCLTKTHSIEKWEEYSRYRRKYDILCRLEDKGYFNRRLFKHRTSLLRMVGVFIRSVFWRTKNRDFSGTSGICGAGTIEMQLIRCIGLEFGSYRCFARRKLFELFYTNLIINSYLRRFARNSPKRGNYRYWLIRVYLDSVPVKMGKSALNPLSLPEGETTFDFIFGKPFEQLTDEEFFVWCLGLLHYENGVGANAVALHRSEIKGLELDEGVISEIVKRLRER